MDVSHHLQQWLAQYVLNGCLLFWNLRTRSRLFPMYNSCTTHHGFQLYLPSPPSQLLTIHTPTSLENLEALEHLGSDPVLFLTHAVLPFLRPFPNLTQPSKSDSKHHLPSEATSSLPGLCGFQDLLSALPQTFLQCLCLPRRQKSTSLKAGEMGPFCASPALTVPVMSRCLVDGHLY